MREDYKYIDGACALCLCTTPLGDAKIETYSDGKMEVPDDIITEVLLLIQEDYILVKDGGITDWVEAIQRCRKDDFSNSPFPYMDLYASVALAFSNDWIGVKKVIWG